MKSAQETIARELYGELRHRFGDLSPKIDGSGVNWRCRLNRDDRECQTSCFALRDCCEYLTAFKLGAKSVAFARTNSSVDTLAVVTDWLAGLDLQELYARYQFIDRQKRTLIQIRDEAIAAEPVLAKLDGIELRQHAADIYSLILVRSERACKVVPGKNNLPAASFYWDDCQLFEYEQFDGPLFAWVVKSWLCDALVPSQMRSRFPWLQIGVLADFYEAGNPIEGEFIRSWDAIEEFCSDERFPFTEAALNFVRTMRSLGYDRTLRAGQSMWSLVLSRSRRHGMRHQQPAIEFWFRSEGMTVVNSIDDHRTGISRDHDLVRLTPEIELLLKHLESQPIN